MQQSTSHFVMVRPDHFGFNPETAETNPYQHTPQSLHKKRDEVRTAALSEFDKMVSVLRQHAIDILLLSSREDEVTPDAVFPNNWFTHHPDGTIVYYPMLAPNRRLERQPKKLETLLQNASLPLSRVVDLTDDEKDGNFLEGTGSMVLDRINHVAFAMASPRTSEEEFIKLCKKIDYKPIYLKTPKGHQNEVYHTNLLLSIGTSYAVVCTEVLVDNDEEGLLKKTLRDLGKTVIEISLKQVYAYCGNILEVQNSSGKKFTVMSQTAHEAFTKEQLAIIAASTEILVFSLPTIEKIGGGGVRCMLAEVFAA